MNALVFLKISHDVALANATNLKFDKQHPWHRNLIALHGSLIELCGALLTLANNKSYIGIKPLSRTTLETYVEFLNLQNDKAYGEYFEASHLDQWLKIYKSASAGNPFLASIGQDKKLDELITETQNQLSEYSKKGVKPLSVYTRFEKVGMENEYRSIYNFLSNESHSNIRALIDRHIETEDETGDFSLVIYKDRELVELEHYYSMAARTVLQSGHFLHTELNSGSEKKFNDAIQELEALEKAMIT